MENLNINEAFDEAFDECFIRALVVMLALIALGAFLSLLYILGLFGLENGPNRFWWLIIGRGLMELCGFIVVGGGTFITLYYFINGVRE